MLPGICVRFLPVTATIACPCLWHLTLLWLVCGLVAIKNKAFTKEGVCVWQREGVMRRTTLLCAAKDSLGLTVLQYRMGLALTSYRMWSKRLQETLSKGEKSTHWRHSVVNCELIKGSRRKYLRGVHNYHVMPCIFTVVNSIVCGFTQLIKRRCLGWSTPVS